MFDTLDRDGRTALQQATLSENPGPAVALLAAGARASYCLSANARTALFIDLAARRVSPTKYPNFALLYS